MADFINNTENNNSYGIDEKLYNKLNNDEKQYMVGANYIAKWLNILLYDKEFNYSMWANDQDMRIMNKLLS